jgi:uncharacterized membrane protein YkvA (DUF1232 family)
MSSETSSKSLTLSQKIHVLRRSLGNTDVPWYVKLLIGLIIAYIVSPIDIIRDFIPVLGLLDEAILVPLGIVLAIKLMPEDIEEISGKKMDVIAPYSW